MLIHHIISQLALRSGVVGLIIAVLLFGVILARVGRAY